MRSLLKYAINYYSQAGEDGILEEIFNRLNINEGCYVDVGAHNGIYMSNTQYLREKRWNGLCIEYSTILFEKLKKICNKYNTKNQDTFCYRIKVEKDNLDNILSKFRILKDFDYLDIDIDGYDYYVWKNLKNYFPKVVQIEVLEKIPLGVEQIHDEKHWLTSFTSMLKLGIEKGYTLVAYTGLNMIFVRNDLNFIIPKEEKDNPNTAIYFCGKNLGNYRQAVMDKSKAQQKLEESIQ